MRYTILALCLALLVSCGRRGPKVTLRTVPATTAICVKHPPPLLVARSVAPLVAQELRDRGVRNLGTPFLLTSGNPLAVDEAAGFGAKPPAQPLPGELPLPYEICVPVPAGTVSPDTVRFKVRELGPMTVASLVVPGLTPETTMTRLLDWLSANRGYRAAGPVVEFYLSGPLRTEVGLVVAPARP